MVDKSRRGTYIEAVGILDGLIVREVVRALTTSLVLNLIKDLPLVECFFSREQKFYASI
jgi:hypothetical protein